MRLGVDRVPCAGIWPKVPQLEFEPAQNSFGETVKAMRDV